MNQSFVSQVRELIEDIKQADPTRAESYMRLLQMAFNRLDERIGDLNDPMQQKTRALAAEVMLRVLYSFQMSVEQMILDHELKDARNSSRTNEQLAIQFHGRLRKLNDVFEDINEFFAPIL